MFHEQIKKIYDEVKAELKDNTINVGVLTQERYDKINFALSVQGEVAQQLLTKAYNERRLTETEFELTQNFFNTIIGKAYNFSACAQHASTVYTRLLKQQQITETVEIIQVVGQPLQQKIAYHIQTADGKRVPQYTSSHNVVVWGRNLKSKSSDISSWKGLCDTWLDGPLIVYNESRKPNLTDITQEEFVPRTIESISRMDRNLTPAEWNNIAAILLELQKHIRENYHLLCRKYKHKPTTSELTALEETFTQEIQELKKLGNPRQPTVTVDIEEKEVKQADKTPRTVAPDSPINSPATKMKTRLASHRNYNTEKFFKIFDEGFQKNDAGLLNKSLRMLCNAGTQQTLAILEILVENQEILKLDPNENPEGTKPSAFDFARQKQEFYNKLLMISPDLHQEKVSVLPNKSSTHFQN